MSVSGATIVRNGVRLGYPFIEAIRSILPLCDELVVGVGDSDDGTREKVASLGDPRIRIIDTVWDMTRRSGGTLLSEQTNRVLAECRGDWIFYIQADEAANEDEFGAVRASLLTAEKDPSIDGIAFDYLHFYGSYYTVQAGRNWYRQEVRIIKNGRGIVSHGDAQGFRRSGKKISAANCHAHIYHYGWARPPEVMAEKIRSFHRFWHDDAWIEKNCAGKEIREFFSDLGNLVPFAGAHPKIMEGLLNRDSLPFIQQCRAEYLKKRTFARMLRDWVRLTPAGEHRNFRPVRMP